MTVDTDWQDPGVAAPLVRLRVVLALLRVLGGRRGHASVTWSSGGFRYRLDATRTTWTGYSVDQELGVIGGEEAARRLEAHLLRHKTLRTTA